MRSFYTMSENIHPPFLWSFARIVFFVCFYIKTIPSSWKIGQVIQFAVLVFALDLDGVSLFKGNISKFVRLSSRLKADEFIILVSSVRLSDCILTLINWAFWNVVQDKGRSRTSSRAKVVKTGSDSSTAKARQ